jgi:hypothetical protein
MNYLVNAVYGLASTLDTEIDIKVEDILKSITDSGTDTSTDNNSKNGGNNLSFAEYTALPVDDDFLLYEDYELQDSHSDVLAYYEKQQKESEYMMRRYNELKDDYSKTLLQIRILEAQLKRTTERMQELMQKAERDSDKYRSTISSLRNQVKNANSIILKLRNMENIEDEEHILSQKRVLNTKQEAIQFFASNILKNIKQVEIYDERVMDQVILQAAKLATKLMTKSCIASFLKLDKKIKPLSRLSSLIIGDTLFLFGEEESRRKVNTDMIKIPLSVVTNTKATTKAEETPLSHLHRAFTLGAKKNQIMVFSVDYISCNVWTYDINENIWQCQETSNNLEDIISMKSFGYCMDSNFENFILVAPYREYIAVWSLNLSSLIWAQIGTNSDAPKARTHFSTSQYDNRYLIIYGGKSETETFSDMWSFDLERFQWHQINYSGKISAPARHSHSAVIYHDSLFVFGGNNNKLYNLWEFCFVTRRWNRYKLSLDSISDLSEHCAALYGSCMYVSGITQSIYGPSTSVLQVELPIVIKAPHKDYGQILYQTLLSGIIVKADVEFIFT